jgi:hypothetical protein
MKRRNHLEGKKRATKNVFTSLRKKIERKRKSVRESEKERQI